MNIYVLASCLLLSACVEFTNDWGKEEGNHVALPKQQVLRSDSNFLALVV